MRVLSAGMLLTLAILRRSTCWSSSYRRLSFSSRLYENPTVDWKGASHSKSSSFAQHFLVSADDLGNKNHTTAVDCIEQVLQDKRRQEGTTVTELNAVALMDLGAVWFLPADAPRDPALGGKPLRLLQDRQLVLGDYLRIHTDPRRFLKVYDYDWCSQTTAVGSSKPGVIVAMNKKHWMVIDKPPHIPVHMTVDNRRENAAYCLQEAENFETYISTPQRLDQNTSGLLVIARSKVFANYFAKLLANKTEQQLEGTGTDGIHKLYRW